MAQIKKLQVGGKAPDRLKEIALNRLKEFKISSKDEASVRSALSNFLAIPEGSFTYDNVAGKFTVTGDNLDKYTGSETGVKTGFFGNLKVGTTETANSLAANIVGESWKEYKAEQEKLAKEAQQRRRDFKIGNYSDYAEEHFGQNVGTKLSGINTNEERQTILTAPIKNLLTNYLSKADSDIGNNYPDKDNALLAKQALDSGDWDRFVEISASLGWDIPGHMLTQEQIDQIEAQRKAANELKYEEDQARLRNERLKERIGYFKSHGIGNEGVLNFLADSDLDFITTDNSTNIDSELLEYLKNKDYLGFRDPNGRYLFLDNEGRPVSIQGSEIDERSGLAGNQWLYNSNFKRAVHSPYTYPEVDYDAVFDRIPNGELVESLESLKTYIQQLEGLFNMDSSGNYTSLREVGNSYAYNNTPAAILKANLSKLDKSDQWKVKDMLTIYNEALKQRNISAVNKPWDSKTSRKSESWFTSPDNWFINLFNKIDEREERLRSRHSKNKSGGILKFQKGDAFLEYKKKLEQAPIERNIPATRDIRGTWKDMGDTEKSWRELSIAGALASMAPGVGAAGAATSLVADIAADVAKDGFQVKDVLNWNTAFNLGFVALSAIGLGALKTLSTAGKLGVASAKGAKAAKVADVGTDVASTFAKASKITGTKSSVKALEISDEGIEGIKALRTFAKNKGIKTTEKLAEEVASGLSKKSIKNPELVKKLEAGLVALGKIAQSPMPVMGSQKIGNIVSSMKKATVSGATTSKNWGITAGKWGAKGVMVSPLITELPSTVYTGFADGWEYTKPQSIKNIVVGASSLKSLRKISKDAKYEAGKADYIAKNAETLKKNKLKFEKTSDIEKKPLLLLQENPRGVSTASPTPVVNKKPLLLLKENPRGTSSMFPIERPPKYINKTSDLLDENFVLENSKKTFDVFLKKLLTQTKEGKLPKLSDIRFRKKGGILKFENPPSAISPPVNINTLIFGHRLAPLKKAFVEGVKKVDSTDVANLMMFGSSLATNKRLEQNRRKALAANLFTESYMPQAPMIQPLSMNSANAEKQGDYIRSKTNRFGKSVNIETGIAAMLEGERQIQANVGAARNLDTQNRNNMLLANANATYQTNLRNVGVNNRNKARFAEVSSGMFKDPSGLANHAALTNFLHAQNQNSKVKRYKDAASKYYEALQDPKVKTGLEDLKKRADALDKELETARNNFQSDLTVSDPLKFEESEAYKTWETRRAELVSERDKLLAPINTAKLILEKYSNFGVYKKGGRVNKSDSRKQESINNLKEKELTYKAIFHNNEMLLKALSILFK